MTNINTKENHMHARFQVKFLQDLLAEDEQIRLMNAQ